MAREIGDKIGLVIGAPAGSVSMHENVTTAVMTALSCLTPHPAKNRIVCLAADFPSTIYLYRAQAAAGFELTIVPAEADLTVRVERVLDAIDERTAFVSLSHVLFKTSYIMDVAPVVARAHDVGARVLLDGYQSAGIIPLDVAALGVDHFTGGCLKWLCGGPGTAFLYTQPDLLRAERPRFTGWFAHRAPFTFEIEALEPRDDAMRMMTGTPSIPAYYAALPGLEIISAIGVDRIRARSMRMTARLLELADRSGLPSVSVARSRAPRRHGRGQSARRAARLPRAQGPRLRRRLPARRRHSCVAALLQHDGRDRASHGRDRAYRHAQGLRRRHGVTLGRHMAAKAGRARKAGGLVGPVATQT